MGFLGRILGRRQKTSREIARERLHLVLVHDRINLSPGMLENLKDELIAVISRYVEIDGDQVEVAFTQGKRQSRLVADIPIRGPAQHRAFPSSTVGAGAAGDGSTLLAQF